MKISGTAGLRAARSVATAAALAGGLAVSLSAASLANVTDVRTTVVSPSARNTTAGTPMGSKGWRATPLGPHTVYGTIYQLRGSAMVLRLRTGRLFDVDASTAIANDAYSAPLFVGKLVTVDGSVQNGRFVATHIIRLTALDGVPADR